MQSTVSPATTHGITLQICCNAIHISTQIQYNTESYLQNIQSERKALCELQDNMVLLRNTTYTQKQPVI